eukprot:gene36464-44974_t
MANCRVDFPGGFKNHAIWTVISPVKAGEELTITYGACRYDSKPTPFRREYYLFSKEFYCGCSRCNAFGDDTRRFNCVDGSCTGCHLACQPNRDVPASLLQCNKCNILPPKAFQHEMFMWERNAENYKERCLDAVRRGLRDVWTINYPDQHIKSMSLSLALFENARKNASKLMLAMRFIRPIDLLTLPPNVQHCQWYTQAAQMFLRTKTSEGVTLATQYAQKALRDYRIMYGRDNLRAEEMQWLQDCDVLRSALSECALATAQVSVW